MSGVDPKETGAELLMTQGAEALIEVGFDREAVARGTLFAALAVVAPLTDMAGQAQWLREMAKGLELAAMPAEGEA